MQVFARGTGVILCTALLLGACSKSGTVDDGPDEFLILPGKTLRAPTSFSNLPEPTPGAGNLTDPTPLGDAKRALGGR